MVIYPLGTKVTILGTKRYDGRQGTVVSLNVEHFPDRTSVEYGVSFKAHVPLSRIRQTATDAWFLPKEITPEIITPIHLDLGFG